MDGLDGLDPTQKASPIRASSDANNIYIYIIGEEAIWPKKLFLWMESRTDRQTSLLDVQKR